MTAPIDDVITEEERSRLPMLGGVVGALLVVGFLVTQVFGGGGDGGGSSGIDRSAAATTTTTPGFLTPPVETYEIFSTRNPFRPTLAEPITTPTTSGGGDGGTTTTTDGGSSGGGQTEPTPTTSVALLEIIDDEGSLSAVIRIDDQTYEVTVGDTFATNYQLVDLDSECARLLRGDSAFDLCVGEEILK